MQTPKTVRRKVRSRFLIYTGALILLVALTIHQAPNPVLALPDRGPAAAPIEQGYPPPAGTSTPTEMSAYPAPRTSTPVTGVTATLTATLTRTSTATQTRTSVPSINTPTRTSTNPSTPFTPTWTRTATQTRISTSPSPTPYRTGTATPLRPTPTRTFTRVFTATSATATATVTASPTHIIASPTFTSTAAAPSKTPVPSGSSTLLLKPVADTYVDESAPSTINGSRLYMAIDQSPRKYAYLRFDVSGLDISKIAKAELRVYVGEGSNQGFTTRLVLNNSWSESSLTYVTAPAASTALGSSGPAEAGKWIVVNLIPQGSLPAFSGGSASSVSLGLFGLSDDGFMIASREAGNLTPQLVITLK